MGQNVRTIPAGASYEEGGVSNESDGTAQISEHGQVWYMGSDRYVLTALTSREFAGLLGPMMNAISWGNFSTLVMKIGYDEQI